jgi:cytochrome P450
MAEAFDAADQMFGHLDEVIAWKRDHLADDLLSALITAEDDGDVLSHQELVDQVNLLFVAGHETTVNLIGNGTLALLRNRDQLESWRDDPSLDAGAVDELLRFDSPVQFSRRITIDEMTIGDRLIEPGRFVMTCLGAANHDPEMFGADADSLDLRRPTANRHLSFGSGIHHCLGAALARLEGQVALGSLIRRLDDIELAVDRPQWNGRIVLRGLDALPLSFAASSVGAAAH